MCRCVVTSGEMYRNVGSAPDGDRGRQRSDLVAVIGCSSVVAATTPPIWEYLALYNRCTQYVKPFFHLSCV
jgi:hypothetical protein